MRYRKFLGYRNWDYLVVFLFTISSGAVFWKGFLSAALTYAILFLVAFCNVFLRKKTEGNTSFLYVVFCLIICVLNLVINYSPLSDNRVFGFFLSACATYLIISRYDYYYFRNILLNIVFFLVLLGILIFILAEYHLLSTSTISISTTQFTSVGIFIVGWDGYLFGRLACIWHEPGACQIILNTILWMHFDCIYKWNWKKTQLFKCLVIFVGVVLTFSTGAYLCLIFLFLSVLVKTKIKGKNKMIMYMILIIIVPLVVFTFFNSPVIQNKIFDKEGENMSKVIRYNDMQACWRMSLEEPILGYGLGSKAFRDKSLKYGNMTTSSGVLGYTASWGFSWLFIYIVFLFRGTKRLNQGNLVSTLLVLSTLIMQFNEDFIELPISYIFLFQFFTYKKSYEQKNINCNCNL